MAKIGDFRIGDRVDIYPVSGEIVGVGRMYLTVRLDSGERVRVYPDKVRKTGIGYTDSHKSAWEYLKRRVKPISQA